MFYQDEIFYRTVGEYLGEDVRTGHDLRGRTFTAEDTKNIAYRFKENMVNDEIKRERMVLKLLSFVFGIIATVFSILIYQHLPK